MSHPIKLTLTDWILEPGHDRLDCRPSQRTITRQLAVTLVCGLLILTIIWQFGLPPGSRQLADQRRQVQRMEDRAADKRKQANRATPSVLDMSTTRRDRLMAEADQLARIASEARAQLEARRPTLGPVGDTVYWIALALLSLAGIGLPLSGYAERVALVHDPVGPLETDSGAGVLRIETRCSFMRSRTVPLAPLTAQLVHAQRIALRHRRQHHVEDHGWLWTVTLTAGRRSADGSGPPDLAIHIDQEPTLPVNPANTTDRVRTLTAFLTRITGLPPAPAVTTDITRIQPTFFGGDRATLRTRRHRPPEDEPRL